MSDLEQTARELDAYVAAAGWDQPTRLFAIVATEQLLLREPGLRATLGPDADATPWTTIEQDDLPHHDDLDGLLQAVSWPDSVDGVAVSAERVMVPPDDTEPLPEDRDLARIEAAGHPRRHELRLTMAVLRDGTRCTVLRLREHDDPASVVVGEDLVSGLGDLLAQSLAG